MTKRIAFLAPLAFLLACLFAACEEANCTLDNSVILTCGFYADGRAVALNDVLTVTTVRGEGNDTVLVNQQRNARKLELPMSYWNDCDTFVLHVSSADYELQDTIWVEKTNNPHFEAPDCPTTMFHEITSLRSTCTFIDSVTLRANIVDFRKYEHIQIHLHTAD